MTMGQRVALELIAIDGPGGGFTDSSEVASALAAAIESLPGLDRSRLLVFGGWESASRGAGTTMQMVGERLGIVEQFQGVDELTVAEDGSLRILERVEGGMHQVSTIGLQGVRSRVKGGDIVDAAHVCVKGAAGPNPHLATDLMYDVPCDQLAEALEPLVSYLPR